MPIDELVQRLVKVSPGQKSFLSVYLDLRPDGRGKKLYPVFLKNRLPELSKLLPAHASEQSLLARDIKSTQRYLEKDLDPGNLRKLWPKFLNHVVGTELALGARFQTDEDTAGIVADHTRHIIIHIWVLPDDGGESLLMFDHGLKGYSLGSFSKAKDLTCVFAWEKSIRRYFKKSIGCDKAEDEDDEGGSSVPQGLLKAPPVAA